MASEFGESTTAPPQNPFSSSNDNNSINEAGDFECNICLELAQDPIVTLCGHLFCWPCLYKWLHYHSHSQACPVCKALIQEEKFVPLYGRGKTQADPRSKSGPSIDIPNRPLGQRPETAPPPEASRFTNHGFGFIGGLAPTGSARLGIFTLANAFGGIIPSSFNVQFHGYHDATVYGSTSGFPYAFDAYHAGRAHGCPQSPNWGQQVDHLLKNLLFVIGVFVILALLCC